IIININLKYIKNKEKDGKPKKYIFRLKGLPTFYIISHYYNILYIKWKNNILSQLFFYSVKNTIGGIYVLNDKAFLYAKYRDIFVRLGRIAGFKIALELY
ncbi:uncharacterized protein K441DRAFT_560286, partial [Cenococcum geophilum 1.58]|uniref:uncharacterized protein n=1 Tax=Cenococcum geophilum 1.58 TaxID=794803 RepID=UPI00358F1537